MSLNTNLRQAARNKNDDFYTQLKDIENELHHYKSHFKNKIVYCNCDDPRISNFFHYFSYNFEHLGLKKLITTCYRNQQRDLFSQHESERAIKLEYDGFQKGDRVPRVGDIGVTHLKGDGDFCSEECIQVLKEVDIVVTNPPFSLFNEYVAQLIKHDKKFVIIGNKNAITYKEIFPLIRENRLWVGNTPMSKDLLFDIPADYARELVESKKEGSSYKIVEGVVKGRSQSIWFTNLDHKKRHEELPLYRKYNPDDYPKYDNYNAINVDKTKEIPMNWDGVMGVPLTFLDKYNPDQVEMLGIMNTGEENRGIRYEGTPHGRPLVNGVEKYIRILIRNRKPQK